MGILSRWLKRPTAPEVCTTHIDIAKLDRSMFMLRTTTEEVSQAAVKAAKVLEERLHDAELRFHSTVDHITDLVIVKDGDGRWKTLNRIGQDVFGWHHGEFFNKTDLELSVEFPQFRDTLLVCKKTDDATWEHRKSYRTEECVPNGTSKFIFDVIKTPVFNDDGTPKELIVIGRDVTEIRERQRRTKACFQALNSASDVIAIVDHNCRIFFCNDRFIDAFNITSYNSVVGEKLDDVVGELNPKMWSTVQKNKSWKGEFQEYQLNVFPMMNGEPKPIYHVCTFKKLN